MEHWTKCRQIIEKHKSQPIALAEDLPTLQIRQHKANPLQEKDVNMEALNLYAPQEYRGLFCALMSALAAKNQM